MILGGTSEAKALARAVAEAGMRAVYSYAGRVADLADQPVPTRVGGFGGVAGLKDFLQREAITHVVDATHPFAAAMSHNAALACSACDVPLIALTRAPWCSVSGDDWRHVPDIAGAVAALSGPLRRVFLAIGRQNLEAFAAQSQHHYLLRLVDPPDGPLPLANTSVVVARGPFDAAEDRALMEAHGIDILVSKNAGGAAAYAKLEAARALGIPVIMIDRPAMRKRVETHDVADVMRWLHGATDLGV